MNRVVPLSVLSTSLCTSRSCACVLQRSPQARVVWLCCSLYLSQAASEAASSVQQQRKRSAFVLTMIDAKASNTPSVVVVWCAVDVAYTASAALCLYVDLATCEAQGEPPRRRERTESAVCPDLGYYVARFCWHVLKAIERVAEANSRVSRQLPSCMSCPAGQRLLIVS